MTKTLTEQWKNGELLAGLYYFRKNDGLIYIEFHDDYRGFCTPEEYIKEVLAPVPSHSEYQKLQKRLEIATKALKEINKNYRFTVAQDVVYKALKEMEGVK